MKGTMVNVPRKVQDPNYRYKMPVMQLKIESKGNGIKTNIVNLQEIAKALNVPVDYPLKYMSFNNGTLCSYKKDGKDVRTIIQGAFKQKELEKDLDEFIDKYVCCQKCGYPELALMIKSEKVYAKCQACSYYSMLDNNHKIAAYMVKKPPALSGHIKAYQTGNENEENVVQSTKVQVQKKLKRQDLTKTVQDNIIKETQEIIEQQLNENNEFKDKELSKIIIYGKIGQNNIKKGVEDILGYIIFQSLFNMRKEDGNLKFPLTVAIEKFAFIFSYLFEEIIKRNIPGHILINLMHFLYEDLKETDVSKVVPTVLVLLYKHGLITAEFLFEWSNGEWSERMAEHYLWNQQIDQKLLTQGQQAISYIRQNEESDDEEDDEDDEDDDDEEEESD